MSNQTLTVPTLLTHTRLLGRWTPKMIQGLETLYTTNLGSLLRFTIQAATFLRINFLNNGNPFGAPQVIGIRVDRHPWQRFMTNQMPAIVSLTPQRHTVEIMTIGNTDLDNVWLEQEGFALQTLVTDRHAVVAPAPPRHHLTFIGDSITAGCWVHGHQPARDYAAETNYVARCADELGCDTCRIAYSAAGIIRGGTGEVPSAPEFITHIDHTTPWVPASPTDRVIINLGVNDRQFTADEFEPCLTSFLQQVEDLFDAPTVVLIPFSQSFAPIFRVIVPKFFHMSLIETADWPLTYTDDLHLDQSGSNIAGARLARSLAGSI